MSEGRKPLTGGQQDAAWNLARKHSLMLLEQGSQAFDDALFAFCADLIDGQETAPQSWWRCGTHGPGTIKAWGCPECVREMREELREVSELLPGPYYMDPPDGGSVSVLEQLQRMAKDAERYRWLKESESLVWPSVDLANACHRAQQTGDRAQIDSEIDRQMNYLLVQPDPHTDRKGRP